MADDGFTAEIEPLGTQRQREYSILDPLTRLWLTRNARGGMQVDSVDPVPLGKLLSDARCGTAAFAHALLVQLHEQAMTGEIIDDVQADIPPDVAARLIVCEFTHTVPQLLPTGLFFNHDFVQGRYVIFEVKGSPEKVRVYLDEFEADYPPHLYGTQTAVHESTNTVMRVRVIRQRKFD